MENIDKIIISTQLPDQFAKFKSYFGIGFSLLNFPMIQIKYHELSIEINKTLTSIETYNWMVFTSMRGIRGFFNLVDNAGIKTDGIMLPKIACIGQATAKELNNYRLKADYINPGNTSNEFGQYLIDKVVKQNHKLLLVLGERADNYLEEKLKNFCFVDRINVYKTIDIEYFDEDLKQIIDKDKYDLLVFTSPSAFQNFVKLGNYKPGNKNYKIASIGNRTTKAIQELGFEVILTAKKSDLEGLVESIIQKFEL